MIKKKAVMFIDIVSSSSMWSINMVNMKKSLSIFGNFVNKLLNNYNKSFIIKTIGDAYMISFESWIDAYDFGKRVQGELYINKNKYKVSNKNLFKVRIGISYGKLEIERVKIQGCNMIDYFGNTVNTASRMESKVSPIGGIGIVCLDDDDFHDFERYIIADINKNNFSYQVLSFSSSCDDKISFSRKRSSRLLTDKNYMCEDISLLKGVSPINICFKININE
jgi:hypothetical protein